jgi:transposase InsO family protein
LLDPHYVPAVGCGRGNRERRDQLIHPPYRKPELLATGPNQLWSWDITKLRGPVKWSFYYLYVILDVFSRYVTGWMIAYRETAGLAKQLIEHACEKQNIAPGQLTIHADRGSSMTSNPWPCCWLISALSRLTAARMSQTTTRFRKPTSKP